AFAQNASAEDRAVLAAVQRPISLNCITVPVGRPLWRDVPNWFLVAENDRTEVIGFDRFAAYVFDYGAPTGFRLAVRRPERISALVSQNGNAYDEGLSEGWTPIKAYWQDASPANRKVLRAFLTPETTRWQYTHGVPDPTMVSPDGQNLDNFYLARPGADEIQ